MPVATNQGRLASSALTRRVLAAAAALSLAGAAPAMAQKVTTVEELTLKQTLGQMANTLSSRPTGDAIATAIALETATAPTSTSSGGFLFKLQSIDRPRRADRDNLGPGFAERAMTSGEGQVSVGATFSASTYDKLSELPLSNLQLGAIQSSSPLIARTGTANLTLRSQTLTMSGIVGLTDNFDVAVVVPMVSIKLDGTSYLTRGDGVVARQAVGTGVFSGLGDVTAMARSRFFKFRTTDITDKGGLALVIASRLPTGDKDNLRGLGINRNAVSIVGSGVFGRVRPHGNVGFEVWNHGLTIATGGSPATSVTIRHQLMYNGGAEVEVNPKVTLNLDFLGQQIRGGGQVALVTISPRRQRSASPGCSRS
ncbi:MAG: hypothetical protein QM736_28520 [Vicinamibacterales bacterium]